MFLNIYVIKLYKSLYMMSMPVGDYINKKVNEVFMNTLCFGELFSVFL